MRRRISGIPKLLNLGIIGVNQKSIYHKEES